MSEKKEIPSAKYIKPIADEVEKIANDKANQSATWWERLIWLIIAAACAIGGSMLNQSCTGRNSVEFSVDPTTGKTSVLVVPVKPIKSAK